MYFIWIWYLVNEVILFVDADDFEPEVPVVKSNILSEKWEGEDEDDDIKVQRPPRICRSCVLTEYIAQACSYWFCSVCAEKND